MRTVMTAVLLILSASIASAQNASTTGHGLQPKHGAHVSPATKGQSPATRPNRSDRNQVGRCAGREPARANSAGHAGST